MTERCEVGLRAYEAAWHTVGRGSLGDLFAADATYQAAPFDDRLVGMDAIARFWEAGREGSSEAFALGWGIVAAQGDTAVARARGCLRRSPSPTYRNLWIITLSTDGRCSRFTGRPFHPGQERTAL
jgi:hypothetical protein